jgi:hypothetical protein
MVQEISNYERTILDRHVVAQQTFAIWSGVAFALVFSYAGALFTFLIDQPLYIRLGAFATFGLAYASVFSGITITGSTLWRHVHELEALKKEGELTGLSDWLIETAEQYGRRSRLFGQGSFILFFVGLLVATIFPLG